MQLGLIIAQLLLRYGPQLTEEIATLLHRDTPPTLDEWKAIFSKVRSLDDYVTEAKAKSVTAPPLGMDGQPIFK